MLLVLSYTIIYNLTSFLLFTTLMQFVSSNVRTLFALSNLGSSNVFSKILGLSILSLAGVPPLLGFFSKIFIFVLVSNSNLSTLFIPLFALLFIALYFYTQNLRFLNSTTPSSFTIELELQARTAPLYFTFAIPIMFFVIFGFCYVDDLLLVSAWVLL